MIKLAISALWLLILAAFLGFLPRDYAKWLTLAGSLMLVAHLLEYFIFAREINAKGDSAAKAFPMTILFGLFYIKM